MVQIKQQQWFWMITGNFELKRENFQLWKHHGPWDWSHQCEVAKPARRKVHFGLITVANEHMTWMTKKFSIKYPYKKEFIEGSFDNMSELS